MVGESRRQVEPPADDRPRLGGELADEVAQSDPRHGGRGEEAGGGGPPEEPLARRLLFEVGGRGELAGEREPGRVERGKGESRGDRQGDSQRPSGPAEK